MEIEQARKLLGEMPASGLDVFERETGDCQLVIPVLHEDKDMVDIFLDDSPAGEGHIRICDFGLTLMRLSYTFDINTPTRENIFESIITNCGVLNEDGNLVLDSPIDELYQAILRFAGCVQKVCNMRYWSGETIRSAFYDDLNNFVRDDLTRFTPTANQSPLADSPIFSVDWALLHNHRSLYLYGVVGSDKAKNVAINLLEFKRAQLPFISLVVHEDMEGLGAREKTYLTRNADKQYPDLDAFKGDVIEDIERLAGSSVETVPQ